jgi:hypothetical protein
MTETPLESQNLVETFSVSGHTQKPHAADVNFLEDVRLKIGE